MLKHIDTDQVQLGMFIHKLQGSWFRHPFWKSKFLLTDADMLATLRASSVEGVLIDVSKGLDVAPSPASAAKLASAATPSGAPASGNPFAKSAAKEPVRVERTTAIREFGRARATASAAGKVVSRVFLEARLGSAVQASAVEPVIGEIYESIQRNPYALNGLLRCQKDSEYVYRHSLSVSALMVSLASRMKLPPREIREAGMAGLMMDIGASRLPVDLSDHGGDYRGLPEELRRQHVELGHSLLIAAGDMPDAVAKVCLQHHERFDGKGYPAGLQGEGIDRFARMAAICDEYDNLIAGSDHAPSLDPAAAIERLNACRDHFDPQILARFVESVGVYPIGSFVELESGFFALVTDQKRKDPRLPVVRSFYSTQEGRMVPGQTLALDGQSGRSIKGIANLSGLGLPAPDVLRERVLNDALRAVE